METTYQHFWRRLAPLYGEREGKAIARLVYEVCYGLSYTDLCLGRDSEVPRAEVERMLSRLERHEPVQYVLGQAMFCGRTFHVEPGVLIPRPETEELCRMILEEREKWSGVHEVRRVLDIGTGSGCIAITLALELSRSQVTAWDISPVALRIARDNARQLGADVLFVENDMLRQTSQVSPQWDLIVSNPPYICDSEAGDMAPNVLEYEPETALFVPDDDPLRFYRPIMSYARSALYPGGMLYVETNPRFVELIEENLLELGFGKVTAWNDQFSKTRFIQARR